MSSYIHSLEQKVLAISYVDTLTNSYWSPIVAVAIWLDAILYSEDLYCRVGSISLDWYRILPRDIRNWKFYNFTVEQKMVYKLLLT